MDYYKILGVNRNSSPEEIKKAYRKLAGQHHPDKGGDTAMFQKIQQAYDILIDPAKKQQYDNPNMFQNNFEFNNPFDMFTQSMNTNDFFAQFFNQNNPFGNSQRKSMQLFRTQLIISLEDAYYGKNQILKIQTPTGQQTINVEIPKGVRDNSQVKYENIIPNTVLIIEFRISKHLKFERNTNDLICNQQISVLDLIVGTTIDFTTISGKTFQVTVPPKTQPFMQLKIAGQGMPILGTNGYGDQILLLKPFIPDNINIEITESILRHKHQ